MCDGEDKSGDNAISLRINEEYGLRVGEGVLQIGY